jgi:hypothetical protein
MELASQLVNKKEYVKFTLKGIISCKKEKHTYFMQRITHYLQEIGDLQINYWLNQ